MCISTYTETRNAISFGHIRPPIHDKRVDNNVSNSSVTIVPIVLPGHPSARMLKLDDWGHRDRL